MSKESDNQNESVIPTVSEDSNTLGDIRINHSVVASIVRLATLEVSGVAAVGGGFVDGIAEIFSKKAARAAYASKKTKSATIASRFASSYASASSWPQLPLKSSNASQNKSRK